MPDLDRFIGENVQLLSSLPANVDPFAYIADNAISKFSLTPFDLRILWFFFIFHLVMILFCVFILVMSYISGTQQARWFVRSLYVKDEFDEEVYKSPVYFINAGILMPISQLMCSAAVETYIWLQLKSAHSNQSSVSAKVGYPLTMMFAFENISHWSVTHCFMVAVYFSRGFTKEKKKGMTRWISSPIFLNSFFIGFGVLVVLVIVALASWACIRQNALATQISKAVISLKQASLAWTQLHAGSDLPSEKKIIIKKNLFGLIVKLEEMFNDISSRVGSSLSSFRCVLVTMFAIICITFAVFILVFSLLVQKYKLNKQKSSSVMILPRTNHFRNHPQQENIGNPTRMSFATINLTGIRGLMANKQLFSLLLRALGIFLSIITQLITCFLLVIKSRDVMIVKAWQEAANWLVIASSTWAAIPIAWQCWRLYADQTSNRSSNSNRHSSLPLKSTSAVGFQNCETQEGTLQIKLSEITP